MTVRQAITHLYYQPDDAFYYWQGIVRYWLYKRFTFVLAWHVIAQYEYRKVAAQDCYFAGECRCCSCRTPELFFASKACSAGKKQYVHCQGQSPCYPRLMNQTDWYWFALNQSHVRR